MAEILQEFVDSRGVHVRVDHQQGVLRGVKLIGLASQNGRRYRERALAQAIPLYEEAKVNVNHPKDGPLAPRDYRDRLGVIRGVKLRRGEGLFGDLHFNPKHALAEQLVWDAEHNPRNVGFSHNVMAQVTREGEQTVVEAISRVHSIDLVADPATTLGLFETREAVTPFEWDALTQETLKLHRPDLVAEMEAQLAESQAEIDSLTRRNRVLALLARYQLTVEEAARESHRAPEQSPRTVSPAFFKMLLATESEEQLEALIAERAKLIPAQQLRSGGGFAPRSRDQLAVLSASASESFDASAFARSLKSLRN